MNSDYDMMYLAAFLYCTREKYEMLSHRVTAKLLGLFPQSRNEIAGPWYVLPGLVKFAL